MYINFKSLKLLYLISAFLFFSFNSCQYDPHAHLLTTTEPRSEDISGTYILDRIDLPENITVKKTNIKVELHSDGTFIATNIPPWKFDEPDNKFFSTLLSGEGRWRKDVIGTLDPGSKQIWGVYLRTDDDRFQPAQFTGAKPPYGLIFTLGDPDGGNAILLKKE